MRRLLLLMLFASPLSAQVPSRDLRTGGAVHALAFHPDGRTLASAGDDQTITLWDLTDGKQLRRLKGHEATVTCLAFSQDGRVLASGSRDSTLCLWDASSGTLRHRLRGHERSVLGLALSPDGRLLASVSYDQSLRLWDVETGKALSHIEGHADAVSCVSFAPDGRTVATGGYDSQVRLWTVAEDGKGLRPSHVLREHRRAEVTGVTFCHGGRLLASVTPTGLVRLRDPSRGEELRRATVGDGPVLTLACSADGRTLMGAGIGGRIDLHEVASGEALLRRNEPAAATPALSFSPLEGSPGEVRAVALSASARTLAAGTRSGVVLVRDLGRMLLARTPGRLSDNELEALWNELRSPSPTTGYRAAATLAACPASAVPFLKPKLLPVQMMDAKQIDQLIDRLDHPRFSAREKAAVELERAIDQVEGRLRQRLRTGPVLETRRRIERLLEPLDEQVLPPDRLRLNRALMALEQSGSAAARELLQGLANGSPGAWLTEEARRGLTRLGVRN